MTPADDEPRKIPRGSEHASRPGIKTLILVVLALIGIAAIMHADEIKMRAGEIKAYFNS